MSNEKRNARDRDWYHRTKKRRAKKLKAAYRRYYRKHRNKMLLKNQKWVKANYQYTLEYRRRISLIKEFGISLEQYNATLKQQKGVCAICRKKCKSGRRLAVDHCHKTGMNRGLLCSKCNRGLGLFNDSPKLLLAAIKYLRRESPSTLQNHPPETNSPRPALKKIRRWPRG